MQIAWVSLAEGKNGKAWFQTTSIGGVRVNATSAKPLLGGAGGPATKLDRRWCKENVAVTQFILPAKDGFTNGAWAGCWSVPLRGGWLIGRSELVCA